MHSESLPSPAPLHSTEPIVAFYSEIGYNGTAMQLPEKSPTRSTGLFKRLNRLPGMSTCSIRSRRHTEAGKSVFSKYGMSRVAVTKVRRDSGTRDLAIYYLDRRLSTVRRVLLAVGQWCLDHAAKGTTQYYASVRCQRKQDWN